MMMTFVPGNMVQQVFTVFIAGPDSEFPHGRSVGVITSCLSVCHSLA
jgi:hypothetical protein